MKNEFLSHFLPNSWGLKKIKHTSFLPESKEKKKPLGIFCPSGFRYRKI